MEDIMITILLKKNRNKHGDNISYCGRKTSWRGCLKTYTLDDKKMSLLYYNVGKSTFTEPWI